MSVEFSSPLLFPQDLHNFFAASSKDEMVENLQGVSFSNVQMSRRPLTSR